MAGVQGSALAIAVCERRRPGLAAVRDAVARRDARRARRIAAQHEQAVQRQLLLPHAAGAECRARGGVADGARARTIASSGSSPTRSPAAAARAPFSDEAADVLDEFRPAVVSFHFGLPSRRTAGAGAGAGARRCCPPPPPSKRRAGSKRTASMRSSRRALEAGGHRGMFLSDDVTNADRHAGAGAADRRRGEGSGDRRRRHRRRERRRGGDGARRGGRAGRHRLPALSGSDDQRGAPRRAEERGGARTPR